jgi:hypothetical protein
MAAPPAKRFIAIDGISSAVHRAGSGGFGLIVASWARPIWPADPATGAMVLYQPAGRLRAVGFRSICLSAPNRVE